MIRLFSATLLVVLFSVSIVVAQTTEEFKLLPVEVYAKIWKERDHDARLILIKTIWLRESTYEDPAATVRGPEALNAMIDKFYKDFPGATITADPILFKGRYFTWNWRILNADQTLMLAGRDMVESDDKGHILKIIGFWEQPSSVNRNMQTVAKYYECLFKTRDFATMATLIAPDATYYQAEGLPYGGTFTGFGNWTKMFTKASELFDLQIEKEPFYFLNSLNDGIIIRFTITCTSKKSGDTITMPISEHFELIDGKIISIRPFYFDTKVFSEFLK